MAADVGCRYHRLGWLFWAVVILQLPGPVWLLEPGLYEKRRLGELSELLKTDVGHAHATPSRAELQRQRRVRAHEAALLYKGSDEWADDPEVVARANSFAQVSYAAEHNTDAAEAGNRSHAGALQKGSKLGNVATCENVPVKGCGRRPWKIKRAKSAWQVAKVVLNGILYAGIFVAGVALSILTLGMFTAFWAPSAALISAGLIASCQTVMMTSVMGAFLGSTFAITMKLGFTGGMLTSSSSSQAGLDWQQVSNQNKLSEDMKWISKQSDVCNEIIFTGKMHLNLMGVEIEADESASDAIFDWCRVMNRHDKASQHQTGAHVDSLWHTPGVMPQTSACAEIEKPGWKRAKMEPHKWFTCYDLLNMQDEEMTYQMGLVTFNLQRSTNEMGEQDERPCSETLFTATPSSTGLGAMCKKIEELRREARAKKKLRSMLQVWNSTSEMNATTERLIDGVVKLHSLRRLEKKLRRQMTLDLGDNPKVKYRYTWTTDGSKWAGPRGEGFFQRSPKAGSEVTAAQMSHLREHQGWGNPETEVHANHFKRGAPITPTTPTSKFKYYWTKQGSEWAGPKGEKFFERSPKIGSEVTQAQMAHLKEHQFHDNPESEVHLNHFSRGEPIKIPKAKKPENVKYEYTWSRLGSAWAGPQQEGFFARSPKAGSKVTAAQLAVLKREQGYANPDTEWHAGNFNRTAVPLTKADLNAMDKQTDAVELDQFGQVEVPLKAPTEADVKKHEKLIDKIKKLEDKLEKAKAEQQEHMAKTGLTLPLAPVTDFGYEDLPGDVDEPGRRGYLDKPGRPDPDPTEHFESEEIGAAYERVERMKQAEGGKAQALHNCLSVASCQMLRKPLSALQGKEKKWTNLGFYKKTRNNVLQEVVQRCLGHTALYGPADSSYCKVDQSKLSSLWR